MFFAVYFAVSCATVACAQHQQILSHQDHDEASFIDASIFGKQAIDLNSLPDPVILTPKFQVNEFNDEGSLGTFAHLDFVDCSKPQNDGTFDIGIVGHPFDLGVSYRPGARFGPNGARQGARRMSPAGGWRLTAIHELEKGMLAINGRKPKNESAADAVRLITIGGDHTITLPILRALHSTWGPVAVLHFDSHLDTWDPEQLGGGVTKYAEVNHGTVLHIAHDEGLLSNHSNMHLGTRCALFDEQYDLNNDLRCGFSYVRAREIDEVGVQNIIKKIVDRVGDNYVYLSVDIDVLDPAYAPATGTIEPGGWSTRELLQIVNGLSKAGLKIVGSDVVEFTPVYDNAAETTAIMMGELIYEILQWMVHVPVQKP